MTNRLTIKWGILFIYVGKKNGTMEIIKHIDNDGSVWYEGKFKFGSIVARTMTELISRLVEHNISLN